MRPSILLLGVLLLVASPASAETAPCSAKYTLNVYAHDLGTMQSSLRTLDEVSFKAAGARLSTGLPCMAEPAPVAVYATSYRMMGVLAFFEGDTVMAESWFRIAQELDPGFEWDVQDFEVGHPVRVLFDKVRADLETDAVALPGKQIALPAGSTFLMDGRRLTRAEASLNRQHLIQQVGSDRAIRNSWLIMGNAFPEQILLSGDEPIATISSEDETEKASHKARGSGAEANAEGITVMKRIRPPWKTPLIIMGGAGILASGGAYAASFIAHGQYEKASTTDELNQARQTTNLLVITSGGLALVGAGVGYYGVLLNGGIGIGYHGRF